VNVCESECLFYVGKEFSSPYEKAPKLSPLPCGGEDEGEGGNQAHPHPTPLLFKGEGELRGRNIVVEALVPAHRSASANKCGRFMRA